MEEKRLECLMMLQIHRSDTLALMQLLTDLPPLQHGDLTFYRTTLCVSAVFAVARCPSGTLVHCIQTAEDIVKHLSCPSSPIILVFWPRALVQRNPFSGTQNTWGGKILRFSTEIAIYLWNGTRWFHSCYGTLIRNHRRRIDLCGFRWSWMTLKGGMRGIKFSGDLLNNARTVWRRTTKFGMVTNMGRSVFFGGQPRHCFCTNASRGLSAIAEFLVNMNIYMYQCTLCSTIDSFLSIDIWNTFLDFKTI